MNPTRKAQTSGSNFYHSRPKLTLVAADESSGDSRTDGQAPEKRDRVKWNGTVNNAINRNPGTYERDDDAVS